MKNGCAYLHTLLVISLIILADGCTSNTLTQTQDEQTPEVTTPGLPSGMMLLILSIPGSVPDLIPRRRIEMETGDIPRPEVPEIATREGHKHLDEIQSRLADLLPMLKDAKVRFEWEKNHGGSVRKRVKKLGHLDR